MNEQKIATLEDIVKNYPNLYRYAARSMPREDIDKLVFMGAPALALLDAMSLTLTNHENAINRMSDILRAQQNSVRTWSSNYI